MLALNPCLIHACFQRRLPLTADERARDRPAAPFAQLVTGSDQVDPSRSPRVPAQLIGHVHDGSYAVGQSADAGPAARRPSS